MFTTEPSKVHSQWETRIRPTELKWKGIWEKEGSHNPDAKWLVDLREDQNNLSNQDPVNITMMDIKEKDLRDEELNSTRP